MNKEMCALIGARLRQARKEAKLTQEEVAAEAAFSRQSLSSWERGAHAPNLEELIWLATRYGVSADRLLFGIDNPQVVFTRLAADAAI